MYTKEQLIHEAVKVLKISYYLIILLMIHLVVNLGLTFMPQRTVTKDTQGKIIKITETSRIG